jgi:hypothetical protein
MDITARRKTMLLRRPVFPSDFRAFFRGLARVAVASSFGVAAASCAQHDLPLDMADPEATLDGGSQTTSGSGGMSGGSAGAAGMAQPGGTGGAPLTGGVGGTTVEAGGSGGTGAGTGGSPPIELPDASIPPGEWHPIACANGAPAIVDEHMFTRSIDYVASYQFDFAQSWLGPTLDDAGMPLPPTLVERVLHGTACANAADEAACLATVAAEKPSIGCVPTGCAPSILLTDDDEVLHIFQRPELVALLGGSVDTEGKALLVALAEGHDLRCTQGAGSWRIRLAEDGDYRLEQTVDECGEYLKRVYSVNAAGHVVYKDQESMPAPCSAGRRPEGLLAAPARASSTELGDYLASMARLEAASVPAFSRVADELTAFGAPAELISDSWRAALDEIEHARAMTALAERFGGCVVAPEIAAPVERDRFAFALENAIEGCVRETYGALVAWHQAEGALDPEVRAVMTHIAEDETRHAQLSWRIAEWLEPQLDAAQRDALSEARTTAFYELRGALGATPSTATRRVLGLPTPEVELALLDQLGAALVLHV